MVQRKKQSEPFILVVGTPDKVSQVFLVVDQCILCELEVDKTPLALLSVFFLYVILNDV